MKKVLITAALATLVALPLQAATLDGMRIHSTTTGTGSKTLMLVHGWTCDETSWALNVPELSKHYRVITLDLPGHGRSDSPKDGVLTMTLFAKAMEAVRAEQKVDTLIVVGHSMGTPVVREYALLYPQHVQALVIVDGVLMRPTRNPQPPFVDPAKLLSPEGTKVREDMIKGMFTPKTPAAVQADVLKMMLAARPATAAGAMRAMFDPMDWTDTVLTIPAYGIFAEATGLWKTPEFMTQVLPKIRYTEIPGTGHFVMMERPQAFDRLLIQFVESL